jgi:hypothetical protein
MDITNEFLHLKMEQQQREVCQYTNSFQEQFIEFIVQLIILVLGLSE